MISGTSRSCWRRNLSCAWLVNETVAWARIVESRVLFLVATSGTSTCFSVWARVIASWVEIFFLVMETVFCRPSEMEIVQTFSLVGFCLPLVEFLTFSSAATSSCAWAAEISSWAAVSAPRLEPPSLPGRQSGRRPCAGAPSWRPRPSRTRYRRTLGRDKHENTDAELLLLITFVEPGSHSLTPELNILDLAEGGEYLCEMLLVDIPGQSPNVNLGRWRRRGFLPPA